MKTGTIKTDLYYVAENAKEIEDGGATLEEAKQMIRLLTHKNDKVEFEDGCWYTEDGKFVNEKFVKAN